MGDTEPSPLTWAGEIELKMKQDLLLKLLAKKFGPVDESVVEKVHAIVPEDLDSYIERLMTASSIDEMQLG